MTRWVGWNVVRNFFGKKYSTVKLIDTTFHLSNCYGILFFASRPGGADNQPTEPKFEPYKEKIRKPGTGCGDEKGDCGNQGGREGDK